MELKSNFIGFNYDYSLNRWVVSLAVDSTGEILQNLYEELQGKMVDLKLKAHREKRSLDANAYYWTMLTKLAGTMGESNNAMHNELLASFSEVDMLDGKVIEVEIIDSEIASERVREASMYHLRPTKKVRFRDGEIYRVYQMMKGSSDMDTKEFSRLVEGLISRCKEAGIPTITDQEAERMMEAYGHSIRQG